MNAKVRIAALLGILLVLATIILTARSTRAAGPWYVAPGGSDSNDCLSATTTCATIYGALNKPGFVAGDTIRVATGVYTSTGNQVLLLDKNATLSGGWEAGFTTQSGTSTLDGQGTRQGMSVKSITAIVERFAIQNGYAESGGPGGIINWGTLTLNNSAVSGTTGNGILNFSGDLTLNNSTVSGTTGLGIYNLYGTLTLNNSTISENTADGSDGGGYRGFGGGIYNRYILTLNNSTVSGNTAGSGGGIHNGGGILTLNNSTISGNTAAVGGGIYNCAPGAMCPNWLNPSNTAAAGGGILTWGTVTLNNSTVSGNTADGSRSGGSYGSGYGGGIYSVEGATVTLQNSILNENTADNAPNCSGPISSAGYNLIGNTSGCSFSPTTGDLTDVDAKLGPLVGSPGYHPLLPGSPAIDAGNPGGCIGSTGPLTTDQRGFPRFGRCDIGAYELQPIGFATKAAALATPGTPITFTLTLTNGGATGLTPVYVTDTLPISLTYIDNSLFAPVGNYGYSNGSITWTGALGAGDWVAVTFGVTTTHIMATITNTAIIDGGGESFTRTATVMVANRVYLPVIIKH